MQLKTNDWKLWLIQSTFGNYQEPNNLCEFAKKLIFSLLVIPFTWVGHLINLIRRERDFHGGFGVLVLCIGFIVSGVLCDPGSKNSNPGMFHEYVKNWSYWEKISLFYFSAPISLAALALFLACCLGAIALCVWPFVTLQDNIRDKRRARRGMPGQETNNFLVLYFRGLKEKYCVKITYIAPDEKA